ELAHLSKIGPQDLLKEAKEMDRDSGPDFLSIVRQLLVTVGGDPTGILQQAEDAVRQLKEQHAGFAPGRSQEDARRRLQNVRFATPHPNEKIAGLMARKLDLQEDLAKRVGDVVP